MIISKQIIILLFQTIMLKLCPIFRGKQSIFQMCVQYTCNDLCRKLGTILHHSVKGIKIITRGNEFLEELWHTVGDKISQNLTPMQHCSLSSVTVC